MHYGKMAAVSYLKKYTMIGGVFSQEKKYLLKEMLLLAAMGVCCLSINTIIIWPVALSVGLLVVLYLLLDVVVNKMTEGRVEEAARKAGHITGETGPKQESQIEI